MITGIDHVALVVRNLDEAVADYEAILGRAPNWHGTLPGARHAWFQFPNVALDVISADGAGPGADAMRADIDKYGEGIWGLGFAVPDMAEALRLFERRGVEFVPTHVTRSAGAGGREREWHITMMRRKSANGLAQFLVETKPGAAAWPLSQATDDTAASAGLDHVVVNTPDPNRALAHYGARLGLDLRLDRSNVQRGSRLLFFRCGGVVVEIGSSLKTPPSGGPDKFGGLAWRIGNAATAHARLTDAGFDVSELRQGRKPGTRVFTVRNRTAGVPTLMLETSPSGA